MNKIFTTLLLLLLSLPSWATDSDGQEADHQQLRQLLRDASEAINSQDVAGLKSLLADEFVLTMVDQGRMTRPQDVDAFFQKYFSSENAPLKDLTVMPEADAPSVFIDKDTAIAYGHSNDTYVLKAGMNVEMSAHWTATLVRNQDGWKIRSFHSGVNVLDNPLLAAAQDTLWKMAAAGAVTGALLMLLLLSLMRRKRKG